MRGAWQIKFIQLVGPYLKVDGTLSRKRFDASSRPPDGSEDQYGHTTPPEIVAYALQACTPDWQPVINETRYRRNAVRESSI